MLAMKQIVLNEVVEDGVDYEHQSKEKALLSFGAAIKDAVKRCIIRSKR